MAGRHNWGIMKRAALTFLILGMASVASAQTTSQNLLQDGNADAGILTGHDPTLPRFSIYSTPGWTTSLGNPRAEAYADGQGSTEMTASVPGAPDRGALYFFGGTTNESTLSQAIDLSAFASQIADGSASFSLSGWLGGFTNQTDYATFSVNFQDAQNNSLATAAIGPVTATQRKNLTSMQSQSAAGFIPLGTSKAIVALDMVMVFATANNGCADSLSFSVTTPGTILPGDFNFDGSVNAADIKAMTSCLTDPAGFKINKALNASNFNLLADLDHSGTVNNGDLQALLSGMKSGQFNPVPEPAALVLLLIGSLSLFRHDRLCP